MMVPVDEIMVADRWVLVVPRSFLALTVSLDRQVTELKVSLDIWTDM